MATLEGAENLTTDKIQLIEETFQEDLIEVQDNHLKQHAQSAMLSVMSHLNQQKEDLYIVEIVFKKTSTKKNKNK